MNEAVKNTMRCCVAGAMAVIMVLTALLMLFVRPKAEETTNQIPILNETIVGTVNFQSFNFLGDNTTGEDGTDYSATFYYTDDYFAHSAINENVSGQKVPWTELDNTSLATCSLDFAVASYTSAHGDVKSASSRTWDNSDYSDKDKNVKAFLQTCGFQDIKPSDTYYVPPSTDSIAYTIANKKITVWDEESQSNKEYSLVAVGIRGAGYGPEWASNVTVGDSSNPSITGRHKGFDDSAQQVVAGLEEYIAEHNISGDVKYWVSGFSRSAAVANLTAGYITDRAAEFGTKQKDIYGYTYECPQCAEETENALNYKNIHNIVNQMDLVPRVSPTEFHHQRLGVDYVMPYHGNTTPTDNEEYYARMYRVLQTIAVGKTFRDEYTEDPLIAAINPSNYPYNRPMTPYKMSVTKLLQDALFNRLMTEFGTEESKKDTGIFSGGNVEKVLGDLDDDGDCDWYLDNMLDAIMNVFLVSTAWDRGYEPTDDIDTHKLRFIGNYQEDMRNVLGYLLGFSGPAFLGLVDSLMANITSVLKLSNADLVVVFTAFYNNPTGSYSRYNYLVKESWRGKSYKDCLIQEAKDVALDIVNDMTADYTHPTITRAQMNASLEKLTGLVVDLYADELDRFESQYLGTFLRLMNVILSTHEQETVLSWITSLDDNHMNRSYRTLTVPVGTNVKLYEFREQYGETLSADGVAPLVAEFTNGMQVSSLDHRIYIESNDTTMNIRYPSSLDIRSDVTLLPGSSAVADLDYRVADFSTEQDTTDVSVGASQFQTLNDSRRYTEITNNTSRTNAMAINSASATEAVALGPYDTLKILTNGSTSFDNHNTGDENVYTVDVERYHVVTVEETLEDLEGTADANFTLALTLTPPAGGSMPEGGLDVFYNDTTLHFGPNATLENLPADGTVSSLVLPEGWTLAMSQPSANGYLTQKYTITPTGGTASIVEGETASLVVSGDMAVTIQSLYYLPPPTGILEDTGESVPLLIAIVLIMCGGAGIAYVYRKKDEFVG